VRWRGGRWSVRAIVEMEERTGACRELWRRPEPLWIFGAGADAAPVAGIGAELGWEVEVVDLRGRLRADRAFAGAVCGRRIEDWAELEERARAAFFFARGDGRIIFWPGS